MEVAENKNFMDVMRHDDIDIKTVVHMTVSNHMRDDCRRHYKMALRKNAYPDGTQAPVHRTFYVDKGHVDGPEIHCVTEKGVIFILNQEKYEREKRYGYFCHPLVTVLFARPNQVARLYHAIGEEPPESILSWCTKWQRDKRHNKRS